MMIDTAHPWSQARTDLVPMSGATSAEPLPNRNLGKRKGMQKEMKVRTSLLT